MNKLKKSILLAFAILSFANIAIAQCPEGELPSCESFPATPPAPLSDDELNIVFSENFDGDNSSGVIPSFSLSCYTDPTEYFGIVCNAGAGCSNEVGAGFVYNGASGQFLGARDLENCIGPFDDDLQSVSFDGFDISSCINPMTLCFSLAESQNMGGVNGSEYGMTNMREDTWDNTTQLNIGVNIDGVFSSITSVQSTGNSDTRPGLDFSCDGSASGGPLLTDTFTQYCFQLPSLGSTMDLVFDFIAFTSNGEDIAIDDIMVFCPDDPAGNPLGSLSPSCTPFIETFDGEIFIEDFDGGNGTNPPSFTYSCYDDSRDYFEIVCNDGAGCSQEVDDDYAYFGASGSFLGLRDTDGGGPCNNDATLPETVSFNGIDISACSSPEILYLCFSIAETRNMGGANGAEWGNTNMRDDTWDGNTSILISANIDGAGVLPITAFEAQVGSDSTPGVDLDCDGDSGDAGEVNVTDTFTQFCFNLPNNGATADIDFQFTGFNTGGEDVGIDNISIQCGLPASANILPGKTPFTP